MSRERVYWFAADNAKEGERDPEGQTRDVLARRFRGWHEPIEALVAAATEGSILRNDIYDMDPLPRWSQGRAVLLGDAAHPMTPNLGQGACQAIEDAVVLAACLKKTAGAGEALREYELRRIPRAREVVLRSRRLGVVAQFENPVLCWMRDSAMRLVPKRQTVQQMKALLGYEILTASEIKLFR